MPIRLRGSRWQVDVAYQGLRRQEQASDEVTAKRREGEILLELKDEIAGKASKRWTLASSVERCHQLVWKGTPGERATMVNAVLAMKFFGKTTLLSDIDTDLIDQWISSLEELGNSGSTINRKLACLSKVMSFAMDRGALTHKPKLQRRKETAGRIRWISVEEEKTIVSLLSSWDKHDHVDFTTFWVDTGCRPSEAFRMRSSDVNFITGTVSFWETKNGGSRSVPMTLRVRAILERRVNGVVRPFPYSVGWFFNQWRKIKTTMKLDSDEGFVPYCLRHTCASRLAQKGVALGTIKEWLGHKTIQITLRYAHLTPATLALGAKALDEIQEDSMFRSG